MSEVVINEEKTPSVLRGPETWPVRKVSKSRLQDVDFTHLPFGKNFSDHMLLAEYADGAWRNVEIVPFAPIAVSPANLALHYGQSIFEGVKAYQNPQGEAFIFRPDKNYDRFLRSAERMAMPAVPREIFLDGMLQLVGLDRGWIPSGEGSSLYIRPLMFANDEAIGVKPGKKFIFMIITSPAGPYYNKPLKLYVEDYYVRACEGGVGAAKTAGNYAASLYPTEEVLKKGYDQILWTDAKTHRYFQECGTMNLFVIIGGKVLTAGLEEGTILDGVTRDSVIQLLAARGIEVEERPVSIQEVLEAHKKGELREMFGTGTAANITFIEEFGYRNEVVKLPAPHTWETAPALLKELNDLHYGYVEDARDWMWKV